MSKTVTNEVGAALELAAPSPLPVFSGQQMGEALQAYKGLQAALDKSMPDQLMKIQGKDFRKKGYWRAIRMSFNLQVECISDKRVQYTEEPNNWGYEVTYRATAPNGSTADGDGSCTREEKSKGRMQATVHNVRSHAHTRAMNRAISNLVGFGEVSAEEVNRDEQPTRQDRQQAAQQRADTEVIEHRSVEPSNPAGIRPNPSFDGKDSDAVVTFPATFKTAPKSGKSLVYISFGKDIVFPIKHVVGHSDTEVCVTAWIANKKHINDELPPEASKILLDAGEDRGDSWEPPPHDDTDVPR